MKKYRIKIEVISDETEEVVGFREVSNVNIAHQIINDIQKWIDIYEKITYQTCKQCQKEFHISKLTTPNDGSDDLYCEECIAKILLNKEQLR